MFFSLLVSWTMISLHFSMFLNLSELIFLSSKFWEFWSRKNAFQLLKSFLGQNENVSNLNSFFQIRSFNRFFSVEKLKHFYFNVFKAIGKLSPTVSNFKNFWLQKMLKCVWTSEKHFWLKINFISKVKICLEFKCFFHFLSIGPRYLNVFQCF